MASSDPAKLTETIAALERMDAMDWAGARDRLVAALAADDQFVPALVLIRALRSVRPLVFKQGDITEDEACERIKDTSTDAKERGKRFVELMASSLTSSTSRACMLLVGLWNHWIEKNHTEAVKWYHRAASYGYVIALYRLGWCHEYGDGFSMNIAAAAM
jgi:TPR repeat protein